MSETTTVPIRTRATVLIEWAKELPMVRSRVFRAAFLLSLVVQLVLAVCIDGFYDFTYMPILIVVLLVGSLFGMGYAVIPLGVILGPFLYSAMIAFLAWAIIGDRRVTVGQ